MTTPTTTPVVSIPAQRGGGGTARPAAPRSSRLWAVLAVALPALILGVVAYNRRWIGDDGLIFTRVSQQILDGNGPVFNIGERAEAATSTLWPWLIALVGLTGVSLPTIAVYGALVCSVAGLALATDGARRLYAGLPGGRWPLPVGALAVAALPPFWDFATSGLEMGLIFVWLGLCWCLLGRLRSDSSFRLQAWTAFTLGMGVLVRPDLAIATITFAVGAWLILRPTWKRLGLLAVFGGTVPVLYEIFRMGYYGVLMPNTAIAKEGTELEAARGWDYFQDYASPYKIWIPLLLTAVAVGLLIWSNRGGSPEARRIRVLTVTALATGAVLLGYVVLVGGDFMHGRLLLPGTFAFLLPVMALPVQRLVLVTAGGLAAWSAVCAGWLRVPYDGFGPHDIEDTRVFYQGWTGTDHPDSAADFRAAFLRNVGGLGPAWQQAKGADGAQMSYFTYWHSPDRFWALNPAFPGSPDFDFRNAPLKYHLPVTDSVVYGALGQPAVLVPTSGLAIDIFGLANPLGAHLEIDFRTRSGHDKMTPPEWIVADFTPRGAPIDMRGLDPVKLEAARNALECGPVKELQQATREPMSMGRFWKNLTGSVERHSFRIPTDPVEAEKKFCKK